MYAYIVFQPIHSYNPCGDEMVVGVYDNRDSAYACLDAGVKATLLRRVEQFILQSEYKPDEDFSVLEQDEEEAGNIMETIL